MAHRSIIFFLQHAFDRRQPGSEFSILGLHAIDIGMQRFDLTCRHIGARKIIECGTQRPQLLLQDGKRASDQRQTIQLGLYGRQFLLQKSAEIFIGHVPRFIGRAESRQVSRERRPAC